MSLRAKPKSLSKVLEHWESRDNQDPMKYAMGDLLDSYYKLARLEAHLDSMFGQGACVKLLRRADPPDAEETYFEEPCKHTNTQRDSRGDVWCPDCNMVLF